MSPRWQKVVRDLTSHPVRTSLVVLSIAVGVFAVATVLGGRSILLREFYSDFLASNPSSATFTTSDFSEALPRKIASRSDVRAADGRRTVITRFTPGEVLPGTSAVGWDTLYVQAIPDFNGVVVDRISREGSGSWPPRHGGILLERSAQNLREFSIGDVISVQTTKGEFAQLRVEGFVHDINETPAQFQDAVSGYIAMETLPRLDEPTELNQLSITVDPTLSRSAVSRIATDIRDGDLLAAGVITYGLSVPEPGSHFLGDITSAVSLLLLAMGVVALALSGFLVVTTVQAIMSQQVRQIGIMKSLGARRGQITGMYFALVVAYGMIALAIGLPLGMWWGTWFAEYAADLLNFKIADASTPTWVVVLVVGVGMLVPLLAASGPIRSGARLPVVRALDAAGQTRVFGHGIIDRMLGLVRGLPRPVALSLRNTFVRKGRLALTLTTLVLASAVVMGVWSVRSSILSTVDQMAGLMNYDVQLYMAHPIPGELAEREAGRAAGVTAVETWLQSPALFERSDGTESAPLHVVGVPADTRFLHPTLLAGTWISHGGHEAVVSQGIVDDEPSFRLGRRVRLTMDGIEEDWLIVGIAENELSGPVVYVDKADLDTTVGAHGYVTRVLVQSGEHTLQEQERVASDVETLLSDANLSTAATQTHTEFRAAIASQLGILVTFLVIMAVILALVGVIGLTGTMMINVLESTREIGVMRSIGASHASIFRIYITEGLVIAIMAWIIGVALSWPFSRWLVGALSDAMGLPLVYSFSWVGVAVWLVMVLVIATIASLLPAWRASQVSIRDAIAYE